MAQKLIANDDFTIQVSDPNVICTITKTGTPSITSKLNSKGIIKDFYSISITAITYPSAGATIPDPGPYVKTFISTALKDKTENDYVCRLNDKTGIINASPQIPGSPPTPFPIQFTVDIVNAGQTKALGE